MLPSPPPPGPGTPAQDDLRFIDVSRVHALSAIDAHSHLHQLPALVLDCDDNVDVERDLEHGAFMTRKVNDYVSFLQVGTNRPGTNGPGRRMLLPGTSWCAVCVCVCEYGWARARAIVLEELPPQCVP